MTNVEFESWFGFERFQWSVRREQRYLLNARDRRFLDGVVGTSSKRRRCIPKGTIFWRAQLGNPEAEEIDGDDFVVLVPSDRPYDLERMIPKQDRAREGRVNPKGIPCLYCATERDTAMAEVRPWKESKISVAQLETIRDLTIVDCTLDSKWLHDKSWLRKEPPPADREYFIVNYALDKA